MDTHVVVPGEVLKAQEENMHAVRWAEVEVSLEHFL